MSLTKKIVLITGANSGIGYCTAAALLSSSPAYHVVLACRSAEKANDARTAIEASDPPPIGSLSTLRLDIDDESSINEAAKAFSSQFPRLDVLINNAGINPVNLSDFTAKFRAALNTNVIGTAATTEAFKPFLYESKDPRIVFLSSSLSSINLRLQPDQKSYRLDGAAYRASKAAVNMYAACFAANEDIKERDGKGQRVKVWVVDPGLVATNLTGDPAALKARGAGDPNVSAHTIKGCIEGLRDDDTNKLLHKDGVYPW